MGITVHNTAFTQLDGAGQFDVITLFDVIEHVENPQATLDAIHRQLTPGGICLILTPNLESLGFSILKEMSSLVMPAEHLFYFTPKSLTMMTENSKLKVAYQATKGMDIPDIFAYYRDIKHKNEVAEFLQSHSNLLQAIVDESGFANHMRFVIRK